MSNWREQFEDESGAGVALAWLGRNYHYVLVPLLLAFAFWNRARNWRTFVVDGKVLFRGNDPWYHYRSVQYTVNNYPETMPFEVWTNFAQGTASYQFGTLYDQLMATFALVVGLGSPSDELVRHVVLLSPALFGMLVMIPAYFIGRRVGGRFGGVMAAAIIAFAPDGLLSRSVAGFSDHHVAEALFQALAVLAIMAALTVAQKEKPVYELLLDGEFDALRRPIGYSLLAGVAIAAYLWTWPPGVLLIGILGVFFLVHLSAEVVRGRSPEHTALVGAISLTTVGLLQLSTIATLELSATSRSLLQPGLAFGVAFGCVFMAWLFREWEARDLETLAYPGAVLGIILAVAGLTALVLPDIFNYFVDQTLRVVGFQTSPTAGTVGEAQPLRDPGQLYSFYRLAILTAVAGLGIVLFRQLLSKDPPAEELLVAIWFLFLVAATFTQSRFSYYLAVPVATLTAVAVGSVMRFVGRVEDASDVEPYQVMTVVSVILIVLGPMFIGPGLAVNSQAMDRSEDASSPRGVIGWSESLDWMEENTPKEGQYANPDGEPIEYYGSYAKTDDYDYPEGAYGVMSWWDYGHWITVEAARIPVANPFQQSATEAAKFLTAQSENRSEQVLNNIDEDDAKTRYVMVDWKMATTEGQTGGKYFAPLRFNPNTTRSDYYTRVLDTDALRERGLVGATQLIRHKKPYYNSTLTRLYLYHGSAKSPEPIVWDWQGSERDLGNGDTFVGPSGDQTVRYFPGFGGVQQAEQFAENDSTAQLGGIGAAPTHEIPALKHYRLVHLDEVRATVSPQFRQLLNRNVQNNPGLRQAAAFEAGQNASQEEQLQAIQDILYDTTPSWTKTFERVPGATIQGVDGPENRTVTLQVEMDPTNGDQFTYRQRVETDENGEFTTTVPYATTDYDELGTDEGYTNTSVRANGSYEIVPTGVREDNTTYVYNGSVDVPEPAVVTEDSDPVTLEFQRQEFDSSTPDENDSSDNETSDNETSTNETSDSTTDDTSTNETGGTATNPSDGSTDSPLQVRTAQQLARSAMRPAN